MISVKQISKNSEYQIVISKSKFIAYSFVVQNLDDVDNILQDMSKKFADATHICYAYKVGGFEKFCDDGEPQGTAGKPILDCIKKQSITNVLVAVVRYFGGIKLGAGGLVRAYSNATSGVLQLSGAEVKVKCKKVTFAIDISKIKLANKLKNYPQIKNFAIDFLQLPKCEFFCQESDLDFVLLQINNLFKTKILVDISKTDYYV